jgi:hypothetical protein
MSEEIRYIETTEFSEYILMDHLLLELQIWHVKVLIDQQKEKNHGWGDVFLSFDITLFLLFHRGASKPLHYHFDPKSLR